MNRNRTVTIGVDGYRATCPTPREGIGFWEAIALTCRGWADARRNRGVPDTAHTHSLHRLQAVYRRGEVDVVRRVDEALSAVDRALAPLEIVAGTAEEQAPTPPTPHELARVPDAERATWAARVREAQAARARGNAQRSRRASAQAEVAVLLSIREALTIEGDDVRRQWREAYAVRAARYTRARFSWRAGVLAAHPDVAAYEPVEGPTPVRRVRPGTAPAE